MNHSSFYQRPHYQQRFTCKQLRKHTAKQSQAGHYNLTTLWWYRKLWLTSGEGHDYLAYLIFRRALGYPLNINKAAQLQRFLSSAAKRLWHKLFGHRLRQCDNLLAEHHHQHHRGQPIAQAAVKLRYQQQVTYWRSQQQQWHNQLAQYLQQANKVQLVGNSPKLAGSYNGTNIDAADIVIRFNQFQSSHTQSCDSGSKCSIWVMAPGFSGAVPPAIAWCLVSGPNMLWQQQRWPQFNINTDIKLLSIPLLHWRVLVRQLAAPPSAGLLITYFISSLLPQRNTLKLSGFGYKPTAGPYHYANPEHNAVSRHNWQAEYQLLNQWQQSMEQHQIND